MTTKIGGSGNNSGMTRAMAKQEEALLKGFTRSYIRPNAKSNSDNFAGVFSPN